LAVQRPGSSGDAQRLGGVGEVQPGDGGDLQAAGLGAAVAAVNGAIGHGDLPPGEPSELPQEAGPVGLDHQQVGGVLVGDQPVGVLALGVQGVGGDPHAVQVQAGQQWLEGGDLVAGWVHAGLGQDHTTGMGHGGQQVDWWARVGAAAAG
jgi:hypothetical protein